MSVIHDKKWYQDLSREKTIRDQLQYAHEAERMVQEAIEKGILNMVNFAKKFSLNKEDVILQVMQDHNISRALAEEKVNQYWN